MPRNLRTRLVCFTLALLTCAGMTQLTGPDTTPRQTAAPALQRDGDDFERLPATNRASGGAVAGDDFERPPTA